MTIDVGLWTWMWQMCPQAFCIFADAILRVATDVDSRTLISPSKVINRTL